MKNISILLLLIIKISFCEAQYSKEKLTGILTNEKSWSVKGINSNRAEKSYTFNKDMSVKIEKQGGAVAGAEKWSLSSTDNIRWFISIGKQKYEMIVSYDKGGKQFIKLTSQLSNNKAPVYEETLLYPVK
ncbi:MAG: hypothetical protein ACHQNT_03240 [Bacteroidia bacterium]